MISIGLVYKLKQHKITKATQFWKTGRLLPQSSSPLEHPEKNNPATLCQASPILGCAQSSLPSKIPSVGKCSSCSTIIQASSRSQRVSPRASECFFYFISSHLYIILCASEAFSFSANPVLDCLPLPWETPLIAPPYFFPVI